jgi:hypothetical protein
MRRTWAASLVALVLPVAASLSAGVATQYTATRTTPLPIRQLLEGSERIVLAKVGPVTDIPRLSASKPQLQKVELTVEEQFWPRPKKGQTPRLVLLFHKRDTPSGIEGKRVFWFLAPAEAGISSIVGLTSGNFVVGDTPDEHHQFLTVRNPHNNQGLWSGRADLLDLTTDAALRKDLSDSSLSADQIDRLMMYTFSSESGIRPIPLPFFRSLIRTAISQTSRSSK